jgi:D-arabinose 1-dehydrogenase-like Zn-dependent alcohol dehydrogenase
MKIQHLTPAGFDLREAEIPVPAPDQIVVQTAVCGVCDGDVYSYTTREKDQNLDTVLGHEGSGVVTAVGSAVQEFRVGDVVTSLGGAFGEYFISSPHRLNHDS